MLGSDPDSRSPRAECTICYRSVKCRKLVLAGSCEHRFCGDCLARHIHTKVTSGAASVGCPMCDSRMHAPAIQKLGGAAVAEQMRTNSRQDMFERAFSSECPADEFERVAKAEHLRRCPSCFVPIQSVGGELMTCPCGTEFLWTQAPTVVPCNKVMYFPVAQITIATALPN
jgi:hypothetical protein